MRKKIICIVGDKASGKTALSIELAKQINAEIISAEIGRASCRERV